MGDEKAKTRDLNLRQKEFIMHYTDKEAKTYDNAVQSAIAAGYGNTYGSSAVQAHYLIHHPKIQSEIEKILNEQNAGYKVRLNALLDIALNRQPVKAKTVTRDPDGNVITTSETERDVSPGDRKKALELLSDLTGETQMAHAQGEAMSNELRALSKRMLRRSEKLVSEPQEHGETEVVAEDQEERQG